MLYIGACNDFYYGLNDTVIFVPVNGLCHVGSGEAVVLSDQNMI